MFIVLEVAGRDVTVEVQHVQGKFAPRDEIESAINEAVSELADIDQIITDAVEQADLSGLGADGMTEYEIINVEVTSP